MDAPEVRHAPEARRFEIGLPGGEPAVLEYELRDGAIVFTHTFVPATQRGHGYAARLVAAGVSHARAHGLRIVPACHYVAAWLGREVEPPRAPTPPG